MLSQKGKLLRIVTLGLAGIALVATAVAVSFRSEPPQPVEAIPFASGTVTSYPDTTIGEQRYDEKETTFMFDRKGDWILYGQGWGGAQPASEMSGGTKLHVVRQNGKSDHLVTELEVTLAAFDKRGDSIYFESAARDLYVVPSVGGEPKKIRDKIDQFALSPDGKKMVYLKLSPTHEGIYNDDALGLAVYDLESGEERLVSSAWDDFMPIWSPDGKRLLFYGRSPEGLASLFAVNVDGTGRRQLTNEGLSGPSPDLVPTPSELPVWSPDGKSLAFESDREVWVSEFQPDGSMRSRALGYGKRPEWESDGKSIRVLVGKNGDFSDSTVVSMDLSGRIIRSR